MKKRNIFLIANLSLLVLLLVSFSFIFNLDFHESVFEKINTKNLSLSMSVSSQLIKYFKEPSSGPPKLDLFTDNENLHLLDVKNLLRGSMYLAGLILIILSFQFYFHGKKNLDKIFFSSGLTLIITPIIIIFLPFDFVFNIFHILLFPQGNWSFPASSVLIQIFTFDFFYLFAKKIFVRTLLVGVIFILFSIFLKKTNVLKK